MQIVEATIIESHRKIDFAFDMYCFHTFHLMCTESYTRHANIMQGFRI